jgi:hypothetical protein
MLSANAGSVAAINVAAANTDLVTRSIFVSITPFGVRENVGLEWIVPGQCCGFERCAKPCRSPKDGLLIHWQALILLRPRINPIAIQ